MSGGADFATRVLNNQKNIQDFQNKPGLITDKPSDKKTHVSAQGKPLIGQGKKIDLNNQSFNGKKAISIGAGFGLQQKNGVYISPNSQVQDSKIINKSSGDGNYTHGDGATTGGIHIE